MPNLALILATVAALVSAPLARANDVAMRVQDVRPGPRALAAAPVAIHFNMLAVHWTGAGIVRYRTHRLHGGWSDWITADSDEAPDGRRGPWHDGNLDWTGGSDGVQVDRAATVRRVRVYELWSRVTTDATRHVAQAGLPAIVSRSGWHANEEIVRAAPTFAPAVRLAVVHHTAGANSYTRAQAAAIVRGIEVYHVRGNGWNDIGYNFLVDRFGTVYEGRGGGIDRNVIGAHAEGFNSGTVGVALIGNFMTAKPPPAMQAALVRLLAWRLDVAHVDPLSTVVYTSGGNAKFRAGKIVTLRAISAHRDTGPSECPGNNAYVLLPAIAKRVSAAGLPKLYSPTVAGARGRRPVPGPRVFCPALDRDDHRLAGQGRGVGDGARAARRLDVALARRGQGPVHVGDLRSGRAARDRDDRRGAALSAPALSLTNLATLPVVVAPAPDGSGALSTVTFTLGAPAAVTGEVRDANGVRALSLPAAQHPAGQNSFDWSAASLPDGRYLLVVTATAGVRSVTKTAAATVDRTLTRLTASPSVLSPNGDGVADSTAFSFDLMAAVPVRLDIEQSGQVVTSPFQGVLAVGPHTLSWDGTANGAPLPDGRYVAVVTITDGLGEVEIPVPVWIDTAQDPAGDVSPPETG